MSAMEIEHTFAVSGTHRIYLIDEDGTEICTIEFTELETCDTAHHPIHDEIKQVYDALCREFHVDDAEPPAGWKFVRK